MTTIACECCFIASVQLSLSNSTRLCGPCRGHKFSVESLKADHKPIVEAFKASRDAAIEAARIEVEQIDARLTTMRTERNELRDIVAANFIDAPEGPLLDSVRDAIVKEAQERQRSAYYSRDRAMAAVWSIDEVHHAVPAGEKCSCGKALRACRDYKALDFIRSNYEQWERNQIALMRAGKHHGLPANHPESRKVFTEWYSWKGAPSTEIEGERRRAG